jgi:hypothetical protein
VVSLFRKRTEEEQRYYEVIPARRWTMSFLYFGLIAFLIAGMQLASKDLQRQGLPAHHRADDPVYQ